MASTQEKLDALWEASANLTTQIHVESKFEQNAGSGKVSDRAENIVKLGAAMNAIRDAMRSLREIDAMQSEHCNDDE